jgi:hypothetical protein
MATFDAHHTLYITTTSYAFGCFLPPKINFLTLPATGQVFFVFSLFLFPPAGIILSGGGTYEQAAPFPRFGSRLWVFGLSNNTAATLGD